MDSPAIIVAFIGRLSPIGVVLGGLLLSLLYWAARRCRCTLNVPASVTRTFQGMLLFFCWPPTRLIQYRLTVKRS